MQLKVSFITNNAQVYRLSPVGVDQADREDRWGGHYKVQMEKGESRIQVYQVEPGSTPNHAGINRSNKQV